MLETIEKHIQQSIELKQAILADKHFLSQIKEAALICKLALDQGGKVLIAGNGGSAADAQHIAAELVGRFEKARPGLAAIALTTDTSALTAIANDFGYNQVFARQVEALARPGDVFIGITTSGNSANIVEALSVCKEKDLKVIGLTGQGGGKLLAQSQLCLCAPSDRTATIQEAHIMIGHILCALIEAEY